MNRDAVPVLIGVGQKTVRDEPLDALSTPLDLLVDGAEAAARDAGIARETLTNLDAIVVVKSFREPMRNTPEALADRLGAGTARQWLTPDGGNAPQYLVNRFCEAIARGRRRFVLLAGAEAMDNARRLIKSGAKPRWGLPSDRDPELIFADREMASAHERAHGIWQAAHVYPLFENALRGHAGASIADHQLAMGRLFSRFTEVAAESPHAWYPVRRSAAEIATASPGNRLVGWPYTKFMNAMNQVNQSAALLLTSVGYARELGVPEDRWIHLHGCADTTELWHVSERVDYHSSPAIRLMGERAFAMAGKTIDEMDFIDLYSCFPSAVAIARNELGIDGDDPRPLTVTGGLPFHGGAGNNYSMNAIAAMADKLRAQPGAFGLVTANGGYLGKHSAGIYSTDPCLISTDGVAPWVREDPRTYQSRIDTMAHPPLTDTPRGRGRIETYTVVFGRDGTPERGIIIGRIGEGDDRLTPRFLANAPDDLDLLVAMTREDFLGRGGTVCPDGEINRFRPDP